MSEEETPSEEEEPIQIDANQNIAQGVYSNLLVSHFNEHEFVLDFVFTQPQSSQGNVRSRVIMHPQNIQKMIGLLSQNLENYTDQYGQMGDGGASSIDISFN